MENIITHDYLRKVIAKRIQLVAKNDLQHLINSDPLFQERICCGAMLLRIFDGKEVNQSEFLAQMLVVYKRIEGMADSVYSICSAGSKNVLSMEHSRPPSWLLSFCRSIITIRRSGIII